MIEIKNLSVVKKEKTILNKINLKVNEKDKVLIKGDSGSGKTTLLKSILFFENLNEGEIIYNKEKIESKNVSNYRKNFIYIGQKAPTFLGSTKDFIFLPFEFKENESLKPSDETIQHYLNKLSFNKNILETDFKNLSGGEQQRITILQSLLLNKKYLLLDEITASLDKENVKNVLDLIFNKKERTIIVIAHNSEWEEKCNKIYLMENGKLSLQENK